ncbi:MAG: hypothetical protein H5U40_18645, partial [Polyangiaceae bacterium]|nr:hypothetical protein [Polyangiaceae bacterium]
MLRLGAKGAATLAVGLTLSAHPQAAADASLLDANDVEVALSIRRSLNRTRVDYGVRVNDG